MTLIRLHDAQANLGLCSPHMPENTLSHGAADMEAKPQKYKFIIFWVSKVDE